MTPREDGVVVMHPRGLPAYEAALAAQEAGLLRGYVTALYRTGRPLVPGLWPLLPRGARAAVERELFRRWYPRLDPDLVVTQPVAHLAYHAARRALPLPRALCVELEWAAVRAFGRGAARWLERGPRPRLVHAYEGGALEALRVARRLGAAAVLEVPSQHEDFVRIDAEEARRWGLPAQRRPAGLRLRVERERAEADLLLAPTEEVRSLLVSAGVPAERVALVPYGADPATFRPAARSGDRFRVLYAGHVNFRKGVAYLLEAWSRLDLPGAELLLVGNPDAAGRALLARHAGLCRALPNVPHPELQRMFARSDVFVFPSLAEGSPFVVYEAMAAGLPVVTTENARAAVRHGIDGIVVPIRDAAALEEALTFLHRNPEARLRMGREARRRIEEGFTWGHYRDRVAAIYRHLLEGRSGPVPAGARAP